MGFCARIVPLTCKTTIMDPNGSIIAVLQVEGRFFVDFSENTRFLTFCPKIRFKPTKTRPSTCKTAIMDPLGSIIVVLQVRGTYLAQNPIKGAKRKNRPPDNYCVEQIFDFCPIEPLANFWVKFCAKFWIIRVLFQKTSLFYSCFFTNVQFSVLS